MITVITEVDYKGFKLVYVKDRGWKIVLHNTEILFPHMQAAKAAINTFYREVIPANRGAEIQKINKGENQ